MATIYDLSKSLVLRWFPEWLRDELKKRHYLSAVTKPAQPDDPELGVLKYLVKPGDRVVDLGANIGVYTVRLSALVGKEGKVHSFEPVPTTYRFLNFTLQKLHLQNVAARRVAITNRCGPVEMNIPPDPTGADNFYQAFIVEEGRDLKIRKSVSTDGLTLDEALSEDSGVVAFIKCDVEGHELQCLSGATRVLSVAHPIWLMEVSGDPALQGTHASKVFEFMQSHGYEAWVYKEQKILPFKPELRTMNYLFLTSTHVEDLRKAGIVAT